MVECQNRFNCPHKECRHRYPHILCGENRLRGCRLHPKGAENHDKGVYKCYEQTIYDKMLDKGYNKAGKKDKEKTT